MAREQDRYMAPPDFAADNDRVPVEPPWSDRHLNLPPYSIGFRHGVWFHPRCASSDTFPYMDRRPSTIAIKKVPSVAPFVVLALLLLVGVIAQRQSRIIQTAGASESLADWPGELVDEVESAGSEAYGWQKCRVLGGYGEQEDMSSWSAGVHAPGSDVALKLNWLRSGWQQQMAASGDDVTDTDTNAFDPHDWRTSDLSPDRLHFESLRSLAALSAQFDVTTIVPDPANPERPLPGVRELPNENGTAWRVEGIPVAWPANGVPPDHPVLKALGQISSSQSALWLLEVWVADGGDQVSRIRLQTLGDRPQLEELRFLTVDEVFSRGEFVDPGCPEDVLGPTGDWRGFNGWTPTRAVPLKVSFDPEGRPYDVEIFGTVSTRREHVGALVTEGGRLLVMDGNAVSVNPDFLPDQPVAFSVQPDLVEHNDLQTVNVDIIWERTLADDGREWEALLGVRLGRADAVVSTWDDFEFAYGTGGGVGGLISAAVVERAAHEQLDESWIDDVDFEAVTQFFDVDGVDGNDVFIFSNGWGDGGFPMSRGRDSSGEVVSVVIWRTNVPWRLAIPDGTPPAEVTSREEALIECLAGDRPVDQTGTCVYDEG